MNKEGRVEYSQYFIMTVLFTVGTTILITPGSLATELHQNAWLAPLIAFIPGLIIVVLYNQISKLKPDQSIVEMMRSILGAWLGSFVSILFIVTAFLAAAMVLYDVSRFITTVFMPQTPPVFINTLFVLLLVYGLMNGFDTLARMVEILFPLFIILFILLIFSLLPQIEFKNIQPLFDAPVSKFAYSTLSLTSVVYMPLIFFLMIQPHELKGSNNSFKPFAAGVFVGSIVNMIIISLNILVVGANVSSIQEYPAYHLAQKIDIGGFVERVEAVVAIMWLITAFVKLLVYFYTAFIGITQVLNLKKKKLFITPLAFLLIVISIDIFPDSVYENQFNSSTWIVWISSVALGSATILISVNSIKNVRNKKRKNNVGE